MFVCDEADRQTWPWVTMAPSTALNSFLPSPDPALDSQLSKNVFQLFLLLIPANGSFITTSPGRQMGDQNQFGNQVKRMPIAAADGMSG